MKDPTLRPHDTLTEFERGLLDAAREDRIPGELKVQMAKALSGAGSSVAIGGAGKTMGPAAALGTKTWLWGSLLVLVCAGSYSVTRLARTSQSGEQKSEPQLQLAVGVNALPFPQVMRAPDVEAANTNTAPSAPGAALPNAGETIIHPVAAPHVAAPPARASTQRAALAPVASLQEELALLERARHALRTGAQPEAQRLLALHAQLFTHAALEPEAEALRIELWAQRGERARAKRAAEHFLRRYADHPLAPRVTRIAAQL
jgi:hypothetical protein